MRHAMKPVADLVLVRSNEFPMKRAYRNVYEDQARARAYATLQFPGTYSLAFRDLPHLIRQYGSNRQALDFGCGTGRSSRFLRDLGLDVTGVDISEAMLDQARALDPAGDYRFVCGSAALDQFAPRQFWHHFSGLHLRQHSDRCSENRRPEPAAQCSGSKWGSLLGGFFRRDLRQRVGIL